MRALIIEDDPNTSETLAIILKSNNIVCDIAHLGKEGIEIGQIYNYDIIILDLLLPDVDGYEVLLRLRSAKINTPILILSGLSNCKDKVKGFSAGADDYVTKPFDKQELISRIRAIVRRSKGASQSEIKYHKISLKLESQIATFEGKRIDLTSSEYTILQVLILRKNSVVSKETLLSYLYNATKIEPGVKIIDVFMFNLRRKLEKISKGIKYIETVWGKGYTLTNIID